MSSGSRPKVLVETFPLPLLLACHLASFEVLNLRVNITHVIPSSPFPLVLLSFQAPIIYLYTEVLNGLHLGSSKTEPETRIWVEIIYLRGNPRRPWLLSWGVRQGGERANTGYVIKHCSTWELHPTGKLWKTERNIPQSCPNWQAGELWYLSTNCTHQCWVAALRGKNSLALPAWAVLGWACCQSEHRRSPCLLCIVVNAEGTWARHQQHPLHCLPSCSVPTPRPAITSQGAPAILTGLQSIQRVWGWC